MTALADYIEERKRRWGLMPIWALCPVRGCLSFAPVGRGCAEHRADLDRWARYAWQAPSFGYKLNSGGAL